MTVFLATLFLTFPVLAEPSEDLKFGISMHGEPKYESTDTHLTYANPDAPKGGSVKIAAIGTFDTINPYSIKGKAAQGLNLVYDRLMARVWDEPFSMYPLIAESYEMPEDRSSITFHINAAARFHDGTPITAQDVLFSYQTLKTSGRPNMRRVYKLVDTAKTTETSITFTFTQNHDRETALILAMMPILSKTYWQDKQFDSTIIAPINANGPYRIKSIDIGRSITYERITDYWAANTLTRRGHYNLNEITYEYFRDDGVSFEAFTSGAHDLRRENDITKWAQGYDFPAIQNGDIIKAEIPHSRPERTRAFIFNTRRDIFKDANVRKALTLPFDFDWMNENFYFGQYKRINSYFPNSEFTANTQAPKPFNLRKSLRAANNLLTESGWTIENGKRVNKNGQALDFELLLASPSQEKIALHYQRTLERLGITMRIRIADDATFRGRLNTYDYDMVAHHWQSSLSPGTEQIIYWGCDAAKQQGRFNYAGICDPEIDAIAASIPKTTSRKELTTAMRTLDARLMDGHYMIPLFYAGKDYVAHNAALKRPKKTPLYGMVFESWWKDSD